MKSQRIQRSLLVAAATLSLAVLGALALMMLALTLAGWNAQVVLSGSMEPTYPRGSLLVSQPVDPGRVRPGTPLVFEDSREDRQVTHRVVAVHDGPEGRYFETRGDANTDSDNHLVPAKAAVGRVRWSPRVGMGRKMVASAGGGDAASRDSGRTLASHGGAPLAAPARRHCPRPDVALRGRQRTAAGDRGPTDRRLTACMGCHPILPSVGRWIDLSQSFGQHPDQVQPSAEARRLGFGHQQALWRLLVVDADLNVHYDDSATSGPFSHR